MRADQSVIRHDPIGIAGTKMVYKYQPVTGQLDADGKAWVELPDEFIDNELKVIIDLPQDWSQIWMNLFAGLQLLGGAATLSVACAMEVGTMGVSTLVSLALVAWSADQMYAGANTLLTQQQTGTQAAALFEWAGMPPEYSELAAGMLSISTAMVKGVATSVVNNPAIRSVTIHAVRHGDKLVNRSITFIGQKIKHRYVFRRKAGQPPAVANTLERAEEASPLLSELTIASNPATGNPAAIHRGWGDLNTRQRNLLAELPEYGSQIITRKNIGSIDLAALSAKEKVEFAMFSTGGRRLIIRGDATSVPINVERATQLSNQGWKWSSHVHPDGVLRSSAGDRGVFKVFEDAGKGKVSAIYTPDGRWRVFDSKGDNLMGWTPE